MALNFPSNPSDGDTYENYVYEAARGVWKAVPASDYTLANLEDLNITSVSDGQGIVYDSTSSTWQNSDISVNVYDVETASTGFFDIPSGTTAERPLSPTNGSIRFNTDIGEPEWYYSETNEWVLFRSAPTISIEYLVIAGGAGGAGTGGGGGAGGYRSSISGEFSGGNSNEEVPLSKQLGDSFTVTVGGGGAGATWPSNSSPGSNSVLDSITSTGGGRAGHSDSGGTGGSGGGSGYSNTTSGGAGILGQGSNGGAGNSPGAYPGGGGGGAGQVGVKAPTTSAAGNGGNGLASSVTGSSVYRAGGGGGGVRGGTAGLGGLGGGGNGSATTSGQSGTANTGGGGGSMGGTSSGVGGTGGSGIVIIKYPSSVSINAAVGLTHSTSIVGDYKVTQFTAGTGTVTLS